jgi:peptidoglycan/LPS O-acetylase OafA/YrhL
MPLKLPVLPPGAFRLWLALIVFITHTTPLKLGASAVFLFFALSGYWIDRMWHAEYQHVARPVRTFYLSRLWRIFPVFYAALALMLLCAACGWIALPHPALGTTLDIAPSSEAVAGAPATVLGPMAAFHYYASHVLLFGYATIHPAWRVIAPLWSIDIELQFYVVAPLVIWLLDRAWASGNASTSPHDVARHPGSASHEVRCRSLIGPILLFVVCVLGLLHMLLAYRGDDSTIGVLPDYLAFFVAGAWVARRDRHFSSAQVQIGAGIAFAILLICTAFHPLRGVMYFGSNYGVMSYFNTAANLLIAIALLPYAMATTRVRPRKREATETTPASGWRRRLDPARLDRLFGALSYEVYLIHGIVLLVVHGSGVLPTGSLARLLWLPPLLVVIVAVSLVVYYVVDEPLERGRRRWVRIQPGYPTHHAAAPVATPDTLAPPPPTLR